MGGGDLNLKKSWHPHTMKNQEKVWKAEQADANERRKVAELQREISHERSREELKRIGQTSGVLASDQENKKLEWMYKGSGELLNREDYLLGRTIDKNFEQLSAAEKEEDQQKLLGITVPKNHVEHECVPFSIRSYRGSETTEQVDMQRKLMEDPLMAIKQKEMETRRKILENPVKLRELHRMLKTERADDENPSTLTKGKKSKKSKKNKKKKSKRARSSSSASSSNETNLDALLAKKYMKVQEEINKEDPNNASMDFNELLNMKYEKLSKELDKVNKKKSKKTEDPDNEKVRPKRDDSCSSYDSERRYNNKPQFKKHDHQNFKNSNRRNINNHNFREKNLLNESRNNRYPFNAKGNSYRGRSPISRNGPIRHSRSPHQKISGSRDKSNSKRSARTTSRSPRKRKSQDKSPTSSSNRQRKRSKSSPQTNSRSDPFHSKKKHRSRTPDIRLETKNRSPQPVKSTTPIRQMRFPEKPKKLPGGETSRRSHSTSFSFSSNSTPNESPTRKKNYGLVTADGKKIALRNDNNSNYKTGNKTTKSKAESTVPLQPKQKLTEKEKQQKLTEMMKNAKWRESDREKHVKIYRKEAQEEGDKHISSDFDKNFINKELHKALINQKTVESRLKSNINNIQRSRGDMDRNFAKR